MSIVLYLIPESSYFLVSSFLGPTIGCTREMSCSSNAILTFNCSCSMRDADKLTVFFCRIYEREASRKDSLSGIASLGVRNKSRKRSALAG